MTLLRAGGEAGSAPPRRSKLLRTGLIVLAVTALVGAGIVTDALRAPGDDPAAAKLAEWARDHGLGRLVTQAERWQYAASPPAEGGEPAGGIPQVATGPSTGPRLPALAAGHALPGEGAWQTVSAVAGRPAVEVAYLRPDPKHTSYVVGVLRMDPTFVAGQLRPGTRDPGGHWPEASSLTGTARADVVAAFNGGFRLTDPSHPGYLADGRTVAPLLDGLASLVLYRDGHADVGAWNREVRLTPDVVSVRQNLTPLVDSGAVTPRCATGGHREWGSTVGQAAYVDRSGFGVTADGHEIYVAGPAMSVCTLGAVLADAGVVRGMELDINPAWVSGAYFTSGAVGHRLYPAQKVDPEHYLAASSRDWFAWTRRS
jgi:hypothetical protein